MISFLCKRWFLVTMLAGLVLAGARPDWLGAVVHDLSPLAVVAPASFLMAWTLDSRRLAGAVRRPGPALWASAISYGLVPLLGWWANALLPDPELSLGVMIITSVPCTLVSAALWTRLAAGNEAAALLATLLTSSTSWLATTAWLALGTGTIVRLNAAALMSELFQVLVLPVALGQLCRAVPWSARLASRHREALGVVSKLLILAIILKAAVGLAERVADGTGTSAAALLVTASVCLGIHLLALGWGWWSSRLLRFERASQIAVAFAGSQKTLPVALYLFETHFRSYTLAVAPVFIYHVGQLVVDTFIAEYLARPSAKPPNVPAESLSPPSSEGL
jgi:sodium/bile acid cotransporter 7